MVALGDPLTLLTKGNRGTDTELGLQMRFSHLDAAILSFTSSAQVMQKGEVHWH